MRPADPRGDCPGPIDAALLMDYWLAALPEAEEAAVEEHLMSCDRCGDRLREAIALSEALRTLARSGSLRVVVGDRLLERAADAGRRTREYAARPGGVVHCTVAADDDFLVARLAADLDGAGQVDLSVCDAAGVERLRMTDIPIRDDAGGIVLQESMTWAKAAPTETMIMRLVAVGASGTERLLGEYTFHHTRTIQDE